MATAPLLMAFPGARLLRLSERGLKSATLETTDHYRLLLGFCTNRANSCALRSRNSLRQACDDGLCERLSVAAFASTGLPHQLTNP